MKDNANAMILAAFAADALALGAHWIYDTDQIAGRFHRMETFQTPGPDSYHPTKNAGEFTHYGDQTMVLLESVADCRGFDINHFAGLWQQHLQTYSGYIDHATRTTLGRFKEEMTPETAGSSSTDLGGASRMAPLVYAYRNAPEEMEKSARMQTAMTHNHILVIDSAAFFAAAAYRILEGESPVAAIESVSSTRFQREPFQSWVRQGLESRASDTIQAIKGFGQMCDVQAAFPGVIHLIAKYETDLKRALIENVMAGGDSAARGMIAGMLLGAFHGMSAIPGPWLEKLSARHKITALMAEIDTWHVSISGKRIPLEVQNGLKYNGH